jgi:KaiC/GvpD/RAD55 family RecA-like ATPase
MGLGGLVSAPQADGFGNNPLRFGIPSLDHLISGRESASGELPIGNRSTSLCILGPDGTGKSVLGLHLAAHYLHDCFTIGNVPTVLYVSTDLSHSIAASRTWIPFGLNYPNDRIVPFADSRSRSCQRPSGPEISLRKLMPMGDVATGASRADALSMFLNRSSAPSADTLLEVGFVDLAANTAGDDWGFINRVLAVLPAPQGKQRLHLMVIDAVEGFETLVGDLDAYGLVSSRRARIAQIMRSAYNKCHIAFIVEEPKEGQRLPEEFVTDVVIRLRKITAGDYIRRTIEVEKARGQEHVRGQHPYVIRSGRGSTTGDQENVDDPRIPSLIYRTTQASTGVARDALAKAKDADSFQSYFHVFSSLHHYSRSVMQKAGAPRPPKPDDEYAAFGIRYLDNMLAGHVEQNLKSTPNGFDSMGLPCASVTALIGDSLTQKTRLGRAFLSRCFVSYSVRLRELADACLSGFVAAKALLEGWNVEPRVIEEHLKLCSAWTPSSEERRGSEARQAALDLAFQILGNSSAMNPHDGFAVLITTVDVDAVALVKDFVRWLLKDSRTPNDYPGFADKLMRYCRARTLCRRLEIHDLSSPILMHIAESAIQEAQLKLRDGKPIETDTDKRFAASHSIRVVIDDLRTLMDTYPGIRNDSLLLPALLFHFRREGVTTLVIDTHTGQPDASQIEPLDSELRALVDQRLYTWRVPFYGENRVAIAAIPPLSEAGVRELKTSLVIGLPDPAQSREVDPDQDLVVDPVFELYSGLEERRPQPVPLEVHLYEETGAFRTYIDQENRLYQKVFASTTMQAGQRREIIIGEPAAEYDSLRDLCYIENEIRLDHTLVFQVDEFWATRPKNALREITSYLREATTAQGRRCPGVDPFVLFQPTLESQPQASETRERFEAFPVHFPKNGTVPTGRVDRVPFTWDFGFLLCRTRAWELESKSNPKVERCWSGLRKTTDLPETRSAKATTVTWYDFLSACAEVARSESARAGTPIPAFDVSLLAPESFSCLVLEMWASEIFNRASRSPHAGLCDRDWSMGSQHGLIEWLDEGVDLWKVYQEWKDSVKSINFQRLLARPL